MRIPTRSRLATALAGALALSLAASAAAEEPAAGTPAAWRFDVRVVRVNARSETVEQAPTLPGAQPDGTTTAPWPDLLAALKARGATQILMDRSNTGLSSHVLSIVQTQTETYVAFVRSDKNNANHEARPLSTGAKAELVVQSPPTGLARLDFAVEATWARASPHRTAPIMLSASWKGLHVLGGDATLVLRHAEQDGMGGGTEVYVLIGMRRLPN